MSIEPLKSTSEDVIEVLGVDWLLLEAVEESRLVPPKKFSIQCSLNNICFIIKKNKMVFLWMLGMVQDIGLLISLISKGSKVLNEIELRKIIINSASFLLISTIFFLFKLSSHFG